MMKEMKGVVSIVVFLFLGLLHPCLSGLLSTSIK